MKVFCIFNGVLIALIVRNAQRWLHMSLYQFSHHMTEFGALMLLLMAFFFFFNSFQYFFLPAIFHEGSREGLKIAFRLYRGPLLVIQFLFLMGVNVYGWRSSGVNHVLIFELDPRNHLSEQHLMELAAIFGVIWTLSVLSFLYSASLSVPPFVNPLALGVIMAVFVLNPIKVFRHEARFWALRVMVSS